MIRLQVTSEWHWRWHCSERVTLFYLQSEKRRRWPLKMLPMRSWTLSSLQDLWMYPLLHVNACKLCVCQKCSESQIFTLPAMFSMTRANPTVSWRKRRVTLNWDATFLILPSLRSMQVNTHTHRICNIQYMQIHSHTGKDTLTKYASYANIRAYSESRVYCSLRLRDHLKIMWSHPKGATF